MDSANTSKEKTEELKPSIFENIKSNYIMQNIFQYLPINKSLNIIKYNKKMRIRLNFSINDYEEFSPIEIEIIPFQRYGDFIKLSKKYKEYYHIYLDDSMQEVKTMYLDSIVKASKIKIIIDHQIKFVSKLFYKSKCIKSINFTKFYRNNINLSYMFYDCWYLEEIKFSNFNANNITDMSYMFYNCSHLKELILSNFHTSNETNMSYMFYGCSSLNKLDLSNFHVNNATDMTYMFYRCLSLEEINLSNFNTDNVTSMKYMFCSCSSLKKINILNFNTNNVRYFRNMFVGCISLNELNILNFNTNKVIDMEYMFGGCSKEFKMKMKKNYPNLGKEAFY